MRSFRFSLQGLILLVGFLAFGFASLRSSSVLLSSAVFTLFVLTLLHAVLAVSFRRSEARAFWIGFLVCGGAYLLLVFTPLGHRLGRSLLTTELLLQLQPVIQPSVNVGFVRSVTDGGPSASLSGHPAMSFHRAGHSLAGVLLGCCGGMVARLMYFTGRGNKQGTA